MHIFHGFSSDNIIKYKRTNINKLENKFFLFLKSSSDLQYFPGGGG